MTNEVSFIRVGGPPVDWTEYVVLDLDRKAILENVVEADAECGWALLIDPDDPQRRILHQGKLMIVEKNDG